MGPGVVGAEGEKACIQGPAHLHGLLSLSFLSSSADAEGGRSRRLLSSFLLLGLTKAISALRDAISALTPAADIVKRLAISS